jgi:hypothetical protein
VISKEQPDGGDLVRAPAAIKAPGLLDTRGLFIQSVRRRHLIF